MSDMISLAKAAISEDSAERLKELLSNSEASTVLSQSNVIDSELGDNLLHFAARHKAQNCTEVLVNQPYSWNPDLSNHKSLTPIHLSFYEADIATAHQLVLHSKQQLCVKCDDILTPSLLFYPAKFNATADDEILESIFENETPEKPLSFLYLLFELLLSENYSPVAKVLRNFIRLKLDSSQTNEDSSPQLRIYKLWSMYRVKPDKYIGELRSRIKAVCADEAEDDEEELIPEYWESIDPMKLKDTCRIIIRELAVTYLRNVCTNDGQYMNYANWLTKLPISHGCQLFLLYNDMWPDKKEGRSANFGELIKLMFFG